MDPVEFDKDRCKGCELCVAFCARGCLKLSDGLNALGYRYARLTDPDHCTGCAVCADMCPEYSIRVFRKTKRTIANVR